MESIQVNQLDSENEEQILVNPAMELESEVNLSFDLIMEEMSAEISSSRWETFLIFCDSLKADILEFLQDKKHAIHLRDNFQDNDLYPFVSSRLTLIRNIIHQGISSFRKEGDAVGLSFTNPANKNQAISSNLQLNASFNNILKSHTESNILFKEPFALKEIPILETCVFSPKEINEQLDRLIQEETQNIAQLFNGEKPLLTELENYYPPDNTRGKLILNRINSCEKALYIGLQHIITLYETIHVMGKKVFQITSSIALPPSNEENDTTLYEYTSFYLQNTNEIDDIVALHLLPKLYKLIIWQNELIEKILNHMEKENIEQKITPPSVERFKLANQGKSHSLSSIKKVIPPSPLGKNNFKVARVRSSSGINKSSPAEHRSNPYVTFCRNRPITLFPAACFKGTLNRNSAILTNAKIIQTLWSWMKFRRLKWGNNFPQDDGAYFQEKVTHYAQYEGLINVAFLRLTHLHIKNIKLLTQQNCLVYSLEGEATEAQKIEVLDNQKILLLYRDKNYFIGFKHEEGYYQENNIENHEHLYEVLQTHHHHLFNDTTYKGIHLWQAIENYFEDHQGISRTPKKIKEMLTGFTNNQLKPLLTLISYEIRTQFNLLRQRYNTAKEELKESNLSQKEDLKDYQARMFIKEELEAHIHYLIAFQLFAAKTFLKQDNINPQQIAQLSHVRALYYDIQKNNWGPLHPNYLSATQFFKHYNSILKGKNHSLPKTQTKPKEAMEKDQALIEELIFEMDQETIRQFTY